MGPYLAELWVYPVKACRGTQIKSSELVKSGLALDRQWCVVDVDGTRYPKGEYLSQRKIPCMATIGVEIKSDEGRLVLTADGMPELQVPIREEAYQAEEDVTVTCGGISTTDPENGSWSLGTIAGKSAGRRAAAWFTTYLNKADAEKAKKPPAQYMLVRMQSTATRRMLDYTGENPPAGTGIPGAQLTKMPFADKDGASFQDFAPFLMVSRTSLEAANRAMKTTGYPITPARASIVVDGADEWDEENWKDFSIGPVRFHKIKECPRCSVPSRNQVTGEFLFKKGQFNGTKGTSLQLPVSLGKLFPEKAKDEEWGSWKAPVFGVYVGHNDAAGTLEVGMKIDVHERVPKKHGGICTPLVLHASVGALAAAVGAFFYLKKSD